MPRSAKLVEALKFLRKHVKASLELEYGASSKEVEGGVKLAAQRLYAEASPAEKEQLAQQVLPDAIGAEELVEAFQNPYYQKPTGQASEKHATSRAHEKWESRHIHDINAQVKLLEEQGSLKLTGENRSKLRKRVSWSMWSKLPEAERLECHPVDAETPQKRKTKQACASAHKRRKKNDNLHNVGVGLVSTVQKAIASGAKKRQVAAKTLFTRACAAGRLSGLQKNKIIPGSSKWKEPRSRAGRPAGSSKMSEQELDGIVKEHTVNTCRWSKKHNTSFRTLLGSRKRIHGRLACSVGYRQLCRRFKTRPVCNGKKRVDVCSVCHCWDTVVSKVLEQKLACAEKTLLGLCKSFFDGFRPPDHGEHLRVESPCYLLRFVEHLESHHETCEGCEATVVAARIARELEEAAVRETSELYGTHFWMKAYIRKSYRNDVEHPLSKWTMLCCDFEELFPPLPGP